MKKLFLASALLTATAVAALAAWSATRTYPEPTVQLPISQYLPTGEAEGWIYEDLPLGATESQDARAHEILNLTDFVYRRYTFIGGGDGSLKMEDRAALRAGEESARSAPPSPNSQLPSSAERTSPISQLPSSSKLPPALRVGQSFEIYVAYWAPGKMPARLMNGHTPDTCWAGAGWRITEREDAYLLMPETGGQRPEARAGTTTAFSSRDNKTTSGSRPPSTGLRPPASDSRPPTSDSRPPASANRQLDSAALACLQALPLPALDKTPGRWRIFEKSGHEIPVVFWHLLEEEVYQYGHQSLGKRLKRLVMDPIEKGFDTRKEQWLVRVSL